MASFQYKARSKQGDAIEGVMDASSSTAVATQLFNTGLTPVDIFEVDATVSRRISEWSMFAHSVTIEDMIQFSRQMYSLTKAGVPILQALAGLAETTKHPVLAHGISGIRGHLEEGRDLANAMGSFPKIFSVFYVSMIRVGETTGQLDAIFLQLTHYLERDKKSRDQIKAALRYPIFVLSAVVIALVIINLFVIPAFAKIFSSHGADLPFVTKMLIMSSQFMTHYWPILLVTTLCAVVGVRYYLISDQGRYRWDKLQLKLPLVGRIIHRATLARFTRLFSMSTRAGVPLITALTVVARALDNRYVEERVLEMQTGLERGESITQTARITGMFDSLVLQMMSVGEQTGAMDELLHEVAEYYDMEVEYDVNRLGAAIEPILTVAIAGMVLILALGVFLPMWSMADLARHG